MLKIKLQYPITINNKKIDTLTLRRPKTKDIIAARKYSNIDVEQDLFLYSRIIEENLSPEEIEELDIVDFQNLQEEYLNFLHKNSPKT